MERMVWVIKDDKGNFVHKNSIIKWDSFTSYYVSHKTFSEECRAYTTKKAVEIALEHLKLQCEKIRLEVCFEVIQVNLSDIIMDYKGFIGENMVLVEISV